MSVFGNDYACHYIIHTQHDCPSQMNSNLLISVTKLTVSNQQIFVHLWGTIMQGPYNTSYIADPSPWPYCPLNFKLRKSQPPSVVKHHYTRNCMHYMDKILLSLKTTSVFRMLKLSPNVIKLLSIINNKSVLLLVGANKMHQSGKLTLKW